MPKSTQRVFVFQVVPTLCPQLLPRTTSQVALVKRRQMKVNIFTFTMIVLNLLWSLSEYQLFSNLTKSHVGIKIMDLTLAELEKQLVYLRLNRM